MIASETVPALLPAHLGVSQTSQFTTQSGLCRHPELCVQDSPFCAAASPCRALTRQPAAQVIMPSGLQATR